MIKLLASCVFQVCIQVLLFESMARAGCIPGVEQDVIACDKLTVSASWVNFNPQTNMQQTCLYNPPPGWVIVSNAVNDIFSNNGSFSVSTIASNSSFIAKSDI